MHELRLETTRKTELVDVTSRVREGADGAHGSAVVLYVPHTTAGIVVQADGGLAVARDVEAALERIVDEEPEPVVARPRRPHRVVADDPAPGRRARPRLAPVDLLCEFDGPRSRSLYVTVI